MARTEKLYLIRKAAELEAGFSPVRNQIRLTLEMLGSATASQLAEQLGRSAESLYYHLKKMEKAGLVLRTDSRSANGREESVYRTRAQRIRIDTAVPTPGFRKALQRTSRTLFRFAERCFERAIGNPQTRFEGKFREARLIQVTARLNRKQIVELNQRLLELETWLEQADDHHHDRRYVVTLAVSPLERHEVRGHDDAPMTSSRGC